MIETHGIDLGKIARGLASGRFAIIEDELHKKCSRCGDYWPADREFFYPSPQCRCGLHTYCRACFLEIRAAGSIEAARSDANARL